MSTARARVGDVGALIRLTIEDSTGTAVNISSASPKVIEVYAPDGTTLAETLTGSFYTTGTDGILQATTTSLSFTRAGFWRAVAYATIGSWVGRSSVLVIEVRPVAAI